MGERGNAGFNGALALCRGERLFTPEMPFNYQKLVPFPSRLETASFKDIYPNSLNPGSCG